VIYALLETSDLFGAYMAVSPSLNWGNGALLKRAEEFFRGRPSLYKFLFIANESNPGGRNEKAIRNFIQILEVHSPKGFEWECKWYARADHMNLPIKSIPDGLDMIFPGFIQNRQN